MPLKYSDRLFVHLLNQAGHAVSSEFVQVLRERGFTVRQWRLLGSLWDEESLTLTELAVATFCGHSTVTRLIERLQTRGFVTRCPDMIDRRKVHIALTPGARDQIGDLVILSEVMEKEIINLVGPKLVAKMMIVLRLMLIKLQTAKQSGRRSTG